MRCAVVRDRSIVPSGSRWAEKSPSIVSCGRLRYNGNSKKNTLPFPVPCECTPKQPCEEEDDADGEEVQEAKEEEEKKVQWNKEKGPKQHGKAY